ncbi:ABC transporter substrate-binding protein [Mangrovibacter plantisponsor]|uniref:Putative spermidine/putrescine transport system substrate-binding protein n=1 Tax=Mangrovibacter plantisponsor TaxID=451513 RepID=A0A317Q5M6_9ENTR|nr:ABC transporter substrate-binding protein [Mangrovibacter plantisponsor]PWW11447.1 putative spermidine/putrescine transport system substrate-binding protein [Mangrovibacter plantisponsor]
MKRMYVSLLASTLLVALQVANVHAADLSALEKAAKSEGEVNSVGMPDSWANWKGTWADMLSKYGLKHMDTDMSSAQELAKFAAEKENATADIGDVGISFGPIAVKQGLALPYKPSTWDQVPAWAKDKDGYWAVAYTGTIAFIIDKQQVKDAPHSWADLKKGKYVVDIGDVGVASQAASGVLAANYALGGDEKNLKPALAFFAELAKQGRLGVTDPTIANIEKGEVQVGVVWDFNGLNYRKQIDPKRFEVVIPSDGSVTSGYTTIINKYGKHPNAAKLTREYIFSDAGQINLARGFARPIRAEHLTYPADVKDQMLPDSEYKNARPIADQQAWEKSAKMLPRLWQENVMINMQQ